MYQKIADMWAQKNQKHGDDDVLHSNVPKKSNYKVLLKIRENFLQNAGSIRIKRQKTTSVPG